MIREAPAIGMSPLCLDVVDAIIFAPIHAPRGRRRQAMRGTTLKTVLLILHRHEGVPMSGEAIAALACISAESVYEATKVLKQLGLVTAEHGGYRPGGGGPGKSAGTWGYVYRVNRARLFEMARFRRSA